MSPTILLVIDAQEGFRCQQTAEAIPAIVDAVHAHSGPLIFTRFINRPESNFERVLRWSGMKDEVQTQILSELRPYIKSNPIFEKHGYSAFCNRQFADYLRELRIESIKICGFDTDACVLATATHAFDEGYRPYVLVEACGSSGGIKHHDAAIEIISRNLGKDSLLRRKQ